MNRKKNKLATTLLAGAYLASAVAPSAVLPSMAFASSHREAPFVTEHPKVDGTDFYSFMSYEPGRQGFVTLIANYQPLQDSYGGPNYFAMDPDARYDINVDNDGDSNPDLTFRFRFNNILRDIQVPAGGKNTSIPLVQAGQITAGDISKLNVIETYSLQVIPRGNTRRAATVTNAITRSPVFIKPSDNIGNKTFPDYASYAGAHLYNINLPGCNVPGSRLFVGQRQEGFVVNLGEIFDLVNTNPVGPVNGETNTIADKNVTTLALEIPASCLVKSPNTTFGAWTVAQLPQNSQLRTRPSYGSPERHSGGLVQVSRLANPLVNEVVIGIKDKDKFNESKPKGDLQFANYVTNPSLPVLLQTLFPVVTAPTTPRLDLLQVFVTGVDGLNKFGFGEMMRLNTAIPAVAKGSQNKLGVIGGDTAGYPNGRRPGDDVVDISLRVVMGKLLPLAQAPSGQLPFTDGADTSDANFPASFPYLNTPLPGSPAN